MAKKVYVGVDDVARKVKKMYVGVENFTKRTLPSGYTQVEYIESSGAQYIDTGYKATSESYRIKCKFIVTNSVANTVLFGGGAATDIISVLFETATQFKFYVGSGSVSGVSVPFAQGQECEMECHANSGTLTVTLNGTTYSGSYQGEINKDYPLAIFSNYGSGSASMFSSVRLKTFQIYDNGTLVRDYVPATNSNGVGGLFDVKNGTFYTNAGTGDFAVGSTHGSVARKIKKGYIGVGGVARPFWTGGELAYYGVVNQAFTARGYLCGASVGNYALFAGGTNGDYFSQVDAYDSSLSYMSAPSLARAASNVAAANVGGYVLLAGGQYVPMISQTGYRVGTNLVTVFDKSLSKSSGANLSSQKMTAGASVGDYAIFGGGYSGEQLSVEYNTVDAYDSTLTKTKGTALSTAKSRAAASNGKYAIFAGCMGYTGSSSDAEAFDASLTKTTATSLGTARSLIVTASVGDYALFAGGFVPGTTIPVASDAVEAYDSSLTRTTVDSLTRSRQELAATTLGTFALFSGGRSVNGLEGLTIVDVYDESLTKTAAPDLATGRLCHGAASVGNYALIAGGIYNSGIAGGWPETVEAYTV